MKRDIVVIAILEKLKKIVTFVSLFYKTAFNGYHGHECSRTWLIIQLKIMKHSFKDAKEKQNAILTEAR